jgi:hypothetical protein
LTVERPSKRDSPRIIASQVSWTTSSATAREATYGNASRIMAWWYRLTKTLEASSSPACIPPRSSSSPDTGRWLTVEV